MPAPTFADLLQMRDYTRNVAPYSAAVGQSQKQYPRFADIPLALTTGVGPGFSETYPPSESNNPQPGKWTVQLRDPKAIADRKNWPDMVSLEAIHALQQNDPVYQIRSQQFIDSMTPGQQADSHRAYQRDRTEFGNTEPYEEYLPRVQAQEYLRGMLFPKVIPNWVGPKGEGQYTPQQMGLSKVIQSYLQGR